MSACYVDLQGSLGDQLFQVATGYAHCKHHGYELRLRTHPENSYWHSYLHKLAGSQGGQNLGPTWQEPVAFYTPLPFNALNLFGHFQTSKYFAEYATEIRSLFTSLSDISAKYDALLTKPESIVVYVDGTCSPAYYNRAIRHMQFLNPSSELILLTKGSSCIIDGETGIVIQEPDESVALQFMSQFKYLVLSTSSLSWWGAWLAEKPLYVIAPTGLPEDYYEARWDRMSQ